MNDLNELKNRIENIEAMINIIVKGCPIKTIIKIGLAVLIVGVLEVILLLILIYE